MKVAEKKQLGTRIKSLREKQGHTQEAFAEICGTSHRTISNIERGIVTPDLKTIIAVAKHFRISIDELLKINPNSKKSSARQQKEYEVITRIQSASDSLLDYLADDIELAFKYFS